MAKPTLARGKISLRLHKNEHRSSQNSEDSENTVLVTYVRKETGMLEKKEDLKYSTLGKLKEAADNATTSREK
jgi:hypothetical protein